MDITDGETTGGDGHPSPASRKLQGTTKDQRSEGGGQRSGTKRKSGKRKAETGKKKARDAAAGVEVQVNLVPPEKQAAVKAVMGPPLPVTGMPRAKGKKSMAAQFMLVLTLASTSLGLSIGLGHASSHNPTDGSHKTVQVQTSARREEVGGQVLPDGASDGGQAAAGAAKGTSNIQHSTPNAQAGAEGGAGGEQETQTRDGSILAKLDEVSSALARLEQYLPGFTPKPAALPAAGSHGRLQWANDFKEIRLGGVLYNLEKRKKARYCIQYLVESAAFCERSARHLENEIDPYVRAQAKLEPLRESSKDNLRIQHYFVGTGKNFRQLYAEVIKSAGNGRFYLHTK